MESIVVPDRFENRTGRGLSLLALVLALTAPGCSIHRVTPYDPSLSVQPRPVERPATEPFAYERAPVPVENHDVETAGRYTGKLLTFPSVGENGQPGNLVTARYYQGHEPGAQRLVVVLSIWGRPGLHPVREMTRALRSHLEGHGHVVVVEMPNRIMDTELLGVARDERELRAAARRLAGRCRNTIIDVRRLLDWAETRPEIDPQRIAMVGFSIGAVFAADVALVDPRVSSLVLVLGGARPAEILAGDLGRSAAARRAILDRFDWDVERYRTEMQAIFGFLDADRLAGGIDPARVLMFEAGKDRRVPPSSRRFLWEAMGRPELVTFPFRHRASFLSMTSLGFNWTTRRILAFLEDTDAGPAGNSGS